MLIIEDILEELKQISYGFVDRYGVVHKRIKKDYYMKEYRLQAPEITQKYKVGTCWDVVELARFLIEDKIATEDKECQFYKKNEKFLIESDKKIEVRTFLFDYDDENVLAKHTIAVAVMDDGYYWLESSWKNMSGIRKFGDIDNIFFEIEGNYPQIYKINNYDVDKLNIYEYTKPKEGLNFVQFCEFAKYKGLNMKKIKKV